ncbi:fructosamine-3-kinase [Trametes versicolor FP-101664 SS1]|uniref:fructosamine-3-kinase n=1 Tax=Trametes versicolor (strain FP-101664) TaxID=717944 RepID=UPI000462391D|nr:fructosamine-3-kinase [Trametes versicolor FP-101664 SS1]EIW64212.1 fructosamine-3-kinase [Trametes versicolor FP-101664 SS1]
MRAHRVFERVLQNPHMEGPECTLTQAGSIIITSTGKQYIAKIGRHEDTDRYHGLNESLVILETAVPGLAPKSSGCGLIEREDKELDSDLMKPYSLCEYKETVPLDSETAKVLAMRLATELHTYKSLGSFGFHVPTYCGPTRQENKWCKPWQKCFDALIGDLADELHANKEYKALSRKVTRVRERIIPALLGSLVISPVLLHGNLWSGTTGVDRHTGAPVILDPACFFGHNEFDLALSRMLGGMPDSFYVAYHDYLRWSEPEEQYGMRQELYQLYHCLRYLLIFGKDTYAEGARKKMDWLLRVAPY